MATWRRTQRPVLRLKRRGLLHASLAAGATRSLWPLARPSGRWGAEAGPPQRGGILRVRGRDPVHCDPHLTRNQRTQAVRSFVYSKLLQHKVGADVPPGTFIVEPDLAEGWEAPDDTTYIFHLRQGGRRIGKIQPFFLPCHLSPPGVCLTGGGLAERWLGDGTRGRRLRAGRQDAERARGQRTAQLPMGWNRLWGP
jgi:hypothetical protein